MRQLPFVLYCLAIATSSCSALSAPTPVPGLVSTIVVQTAHAASTATAAAVALQPTLTATPAPCADAASLVPDVSSEANASVPAGSNFTETFQVKNSGECNWHGYSIAFISGDRMGVQDLSPLGDTSPQNTVTVAMELVAPASAGSFSGTFEIRDASGKPLAIGSESTFTIKVVVGDLTTPTPGASDIALAGPTIVVPRPPADCGYKPSDQYAADVVTSINKARADAGLPVLAVNPHLVESALNHSIDMACNGYFAHEGLNKSTIHDRVVAAGYVPKFSEEMIFCSGYPADAYAWWFHDPAHHDVIVDPRVKEIGAGYVYLKNSSCSSYFTVDFGVQ